MLSLLVPLVLGTGDYPRGISPPWTLASPTAIWRDWTMVQVIQPMFGSWKTLYNTSEQHLSVLSVYSFNQCIPFFLGYFTHLIKAHFKCQWFHWFPLAQFTSPGWGCGHVGQDIKHSDCLTLQCHCDHCGPMVIQNVHVFKNISLYMHFFPSVTFTHIFPPIGAAL